MTLILQVYDRSLQEDIMESNLADDFRCLMALILEHSRDETEIVDAIRAEEQAQLLNAKGKAELGIEAESFSRMLAMDNVDQLRLLFDEYKKLSHQTIQMAIRCSVQGDLAKAMLAIGNRGNKSIIKNKNLLSFTWTLTTQNKSNLRFGKFTRLF